MKKLLLVSAITLSTAGIAQAESAFSYDMLQVSYLNTNIGIEDTNVDFTGHEFNVFFSKELEDDLFFYVNAGAGSINDDATYDDIYFDLDGNVVGLAAGIGKAFALNDKADAYIRGGIAYSRFDLDITAVDTLYNDTYVFSSDDSDISVDLELGARLYLDQANKIEFSPYFDMSSQNGESSKEIGARLGLNVSPETQLQIGFETSLDDDIDTLSLALRIYL